MAEPFNVFKFDPDLREDEFEEEIELENNTPTYDKTGETYEQTETSFGDLPAVPETGSDNRSIEKQEAVNKFYESITDQGWEIDRNAPIESKAVFYRS